MIRVISREQSLHHDSVSLDMEQVVHTIQVTKLWIKPTTNYLNKLKMIKNHVYEIHTDRLIIRCYKLTDAIELKKAIDSSLDHLVPRMTRAKSEPEPLLMKIERVRKYRGQFDLNQDYTYWIFNKDNKTLIWVSWLHSRVTGLWFEIWYWIRSSHIGQWYATEAVKALVRTWFEKLNLEYLEIKCDLENENSSNIPKKLWFTLEWTIRIEERNLKWLRKKKMIWKLFKEEYWVKNYTMNIKYYNELLEEIK